MAVDQYSREVTCNERRFCYRFLDCGMAFQNSGVARLRRDPVQDGPALLGGERSACAHDMGGSGNGVSFTFPLVLSHEYGVSDTRTGGYVLGMAVAWVTRRAAAHTVIRTSAAPEWRSALCSASWATR